MARAYTQTTHGEWQTRLYRIWRGIKGRCQGSAGAFKLYGARGITCCAEWQAYEQFRDWAHASGYSDDRQIDRINAEGPYSPENCRWVLPIVNYARKELPRDGAYLARLTGNLSVRQIDSAESRDRPYKLHDGQGLYLLVEPNGRKVWRFKYRRDGREKLMVFGECPGLSISHARELRLVMQGRLKRGVDPCSIKRASAARAKRRRRAKSGVRATKRWGTSHFGAEKSQQNQR